MRNKNTHIRRTADQWRMLIAEQANCGSHEAFCKHERLALSRFANWKRRLASKTVMKDERAPEPTTWIELGSLGARSSGWGKNGLE